ncbi:MAG: hypothetical protein R3302_05345 [Sulfurimonadaceae bacterium]|nr:hypothetical protein [Sulfurimonadaceae bacterium]
MQKDAGKIASLLDDMPQFENLSEIEEAAWLTKEAINVISELKDESQSAMIQIQKNIKFLESTQADSSKNLDIKS